MDRIFVSYRRSDSQGEAGRLFDDLVNHFGEDRVFMDVAAIEAGRDFRKAIEEGVTQCGVLLVLIGLEWVDAKDERGGHRLNDPSDFVRIETASALKRDIPVIPVLVRGAKMPSAEQLPEDLKELAYRNCSELTHARWRSDIQLLIESLRRLLGDSGPAVKLARPRDATLSTQSGGLPEAPSRSNVDDQGASRIDATDLQRTVQELALRIGPIAGIVVKRASPQCNSLEELYLKVAEEIDSPVEREKFLRRGVVLPAQAPKVRKATVPPKSVGVASGLPAPSEHLDSKTAVPTTPAPSSNRKNYALVASGATVFLLLVLWYVTRVATSKQPGPSPTPQNIAQQTNLTTSVSAKSGAPPAATRTPAKNDNAVQTPIAHPSGKSEGTSRKPVQVPEQISMTLLMNAVKPAYPVLARQTNVQGIVVLDADISEAGTVESVRVISGHPLLIQAALDAAQQWRYKPYMQNGKPVAMNTPISVKFTLR